MSSKQGQGHQTWFELVDLKQGYNDGKFEKPRLNSVCKKANDKVFVKSGNSSVVSLQCVNAKKWYIYDSYDLKNNNIVQITILQNFNLIR